MREMERICFKSNSEENIDFAKEHNVWQTTTKAKRLKKGDLIYMKGPGSNEAKLLGILSEEVSKEVVLQWPSRDYDVNGVERQWTFKFRTLLSTDFEGGVPQGSFSYWDKSE